MKIFCLLLLVTLVIPACKTQKLNDEQSITLQNSTRAIKILPLLMDVDKLGNIYVIDVNNQLSVFDHSGNQRYKYSDKRLGSIHSIDVSNPLNILVFHKDFGQIRILDNTLNIVETMALYSSNKLSTVTAAAWSNDSNFWVFDEQKQKFFKIDRNLNFLVETNHLNDLGFIGYQPFKLLERENTLAVGSLGNDFLLFDNFGQIIKKIEADESKDFQFDGENILYLTSTGLKNQAINYPSFTSIGLPQNVQAEDILNVKLENDKWYVQYNDGIDIFVRNRKK